ncbi:hypothetical protein ACVCAH_28675 [Micromonospora sp. LZ34]
MSRDQDRTLDRRLLLRRAGTVAAGLAGTAAVGATAAAPAQAAPGDPVLQGRVNEADNNPTTLRGGSATSATLRLENPHVQPDAEGVLMAGPALRLTPSGQTISELAEVGSVSMDRTGTIWAVTGEIGDFKFREYVRTNANSNVTVPVVPQRLIDTRTVAGRARIVNAAGKLDSSGRLLAGNTIHVDLRDFVHNGDAVHGNVTVTGPLAAGFVQIFPYGSPRPPAFSTINFQAGQTVSNAFLCGMGRVIEYISVHAQRTTNVIIDVVAFVVGPGQVNPAILPSDGDPAPSDQRERRSAKPSWVK